MGTINRERVTLPSSSEIEAAATLILSCRSYVPMGQPLPAAARLVAAAEVLDAAGIWSPGDVASRQPLPPVELVLVGKMSVRGRERIVYRIVVGGIEVGTATEWPNDLAAPWRLTLPGHCSNLRRSSRSVLRATVERAMTTGQIWEGHHE